MKSKSAAGKLASKRFAKKMPSSAKKSSSTKKKDKVGGAQKKIFMPIQQALNGKTAEAIVIKNEEIANNKADVTDVKIVEK